MTSDACLALFEKWLDRYEATPRWRLWRRHCARARFEFFMEFYRECYVRELREAGLA